MIQPSDVTIYFATRNRPIMVLRVLENILKFCPDFKVLIANCSSTGKFKETSDIIRGYSKKLDVREVIFNPDPGVQEVYSQLALDHVDTEFALLWADDVSFLRCPYSLLSYFDDFNVVQVALPMIDDIHLTKTVSGAWPKDEFGCALWNTSTGRCAHHSILRMSYFQKFDKLYSLEDNGDPWIHKNTHSQMRIWPNDGPYILHTRIDDETRQNMISEGNRFRFELGHKSRNGYNIASLKEREEFSDTLIYKYHFNGMRLDESFLSMIRGKRVAIVGPALYLSKYKLGEYIDDYDVICRSWEYYTNGSESCIGSRTDIVFDNCDTRANEATRQKMLANPDDTKKVKLVVLHDMQAEGGTSPDGIISLCNWNLKNIFGLPFWSIGPERFDALQSILSFNSCEMSSGMIAILLLLAHQPKELFVSGFTFYLDWDKDNPGVTHRKDPHMPESTAILLAPGSSWSPNDSHPVEIQSNFFKFILLKWYKDVITIDSYLKNLLNVDYNRVIECK